MTNRRPGGGVETHASRLPRQSAEYFSRIDQQGLFDSRHLVLMVMAETYDVVAFGFREYPRDVVEMGQAEPATFQGQFRHFAVQLDAGIGRAVAGDPEEVAVVVAKDDMNLPLVMPPQGFHDERRTKIAATQQNFRIPKLLQGLMKRFEIIVNVR